MTLEVENWQIPLGFKLKSWISVFATDKKACMFQCYIMTKFWNLKLKNGRVQYYY